MSSQPSLFDLAQNDVMSPTKQVTELRHALNLTLREAREVLHRRSRFSSSNESLDELCKLLFAHFVSVSSGEGGLPSVVDGAEMPAEALRGYVREAFTRHLPDSLAHEMPVEAFELRLQPSESELAAELAAAFEFLTPDGALDLREIAADADVLNEAFGTFLSASFVDEKQLGQYLTPPEVVRFIVELALHALDSTERALLLNPATSREFGAILDPSCGVGSFLTLFARRLSRELRAADDQSARAFLDTIISSNIVGFDKSERMVRLALTNLALLGASEVNLHLVNSLERSGAARYLTESFAGNVGLIMTNPPFGAEFRGQDLRRYKIASEWSRSMPSKVDSELLFVERYLDWLRPGGRFFAIVPDSILTNRGLFADLREGIRGVAEVELVASLPVATFEAAGTQTKTSVLQVRKIDPSRAPTRGKPAYVAVCREIGFKVGTRGAHRLKVSNGSSELPRVLDEARGHAKPTVGRLVADLSQATRWDATYHATLPVEIERLLANPPRDSLFLSDVATLAQERLNPERGEGETFKYIEISDVDADSGSVQAKSVLRREAPSRARKLVRSGDVLMSTVRPERRVIGVVPPEADGAICSTGFAVLHPAKINPHVLAHVLRTSFVTVQVMRNNVGIAYPAIDESCLPELLLPLSAKAVEAADAFGRELALAEEAWKSARQRFEESMSRVVGELGSETGFS